MGGSRRLYATYRRRGNYRCRTREQACWPPQVGLIILSLVSQVTNPRSERSDRFFSILRPKTFSPLHLATSRSSFGMLAPVSRLLLSSTTISSRVCHGMPVAACSLPPREIRRFGCGMSDRRNPFTKPLAMVVPRTVALSGWESIIASRRLVSRV